MIWIWRLVSWFTRVAAWVVWKLLKPSRPRTVQVDSHYLSACDEVDGMVPDASIKPFFMDGGWWRQEGPIVHHPGGVSGCVRRIEVEDK